MQFKLDDVMSLTAARWAAAEGFDWVSFNFDKEATSYLPPFKANEIITWVKGPEFIGRCLNTEIQTIVDIYELLHLKAIETSLNRAETLVYNHEIPVFIQVNVQNLNQAITLANQQPLVLGLVFDSAETFNHSKGYSFGFVNADLNMVENPFGVNFSAPPELETGFTDFENLEKSVDLWKSHKKV